MAGIWERIKKGAPQRIGGHVLETLLVFRIDPADFTDAQLEAGINDLLSEDNYDSLTSLEVVDVVAMSNAIRNAGGAAAQLLQLTKTKGAIASAAWGSINETQFRTISGI